MTELARRPRTALRGEFDAAITQTPEGLRQCSLARSLRERPALRSALSVARHTPEIFASVLAMMERKDDLLDGTVAPRDTSRSYTALLAGIAATRRGRALLEVAIDLAFERETALFRDHICRYPDTPPYTQELVIGCGPHASIYLSEKIGAGGIRPFVVERRGRAGGTFALAQRPVFNLNSRNRPEKRRLLRRPGTPGPLNSEIGAVIQPSDLGAAEYQSQDVQALVTRLNLALYARGMMNVEVTGVEMRSAGERGQYLVNLLDLERGTAGTLLTDRIIVASGLGNQQVDNPTDDPRIETFDQFIERVGDPRDPFPLKGHKKVAVVGAADGGSVAVEYLLGQAGDHAMSVNALDFVDEIVWIGQKAATKEEFEQRNRSRYAGIGRYMPREGQPDYYTRVTPLAGRALSYTPTDKGVRVKVQLPDGRTGSNLFDHVIVATGYEDRTDDFFRDLVPPVVPLLDDVMVNDVVVGRRYTGTDIYLIGPAAQLPTTFAEVQETPALGAIPDNSVALFRYAERTAALARDLARIDREPIEDDLTQLTYPIGPSFSGSSRVVKRRQFLVGIPDIPVALPQDATAEDLVRLIVGDFFGPTKLARLQKFDISVERSGPRGLLVALQVSDEYRLRALSRTYFTYIRSLFTNPMLLAVLAQQTDPRMRRGPIHLQIPIKNSKVDIEGVSLCH